MQHTVGLPPLQPGESYYFVIESEDLSGNKATTAEQQIQILPRQHLYLPGVQR